MSGTRADRLERLARLQTRLREIEEARLGALRAQEREIDAQARQILESLGDASPLAGLFLEAKANRLRMREVERAAVLLRIGEVETRLATAAAREKRIERIGREARRHQNGMDEAASLSDILETFLARR